MTYKSVYFGVFISLFIIVVVIPSAMAQVNKDSRIEDLRKAAEGGSSDAMFFLGLNYSRYFEQEDEAIKWYRKATKNNTSVDVKGS